MPEKADGVPLAYVGKDTRSATPLILTLGASGGDIIGSLAKDRPLQVLLVDSDGNHLIKTAFGITGWAQQGEDGDSETFPALKTVQDVHYNPELGTPLDEYYHRLEAGEPLRPGKIDGDEYPDSTHYHRLLQTALTPGGSSWYIEHGHDEHYRFFRLNSPDARLADDDERAIGEADSLTLPGNGAIYSEGKDENHYFRTREKWLLRGKPQRVPQPAYYLGKDNTYHGMLQRQQQAHSDLSEIEKKSCAVAAHRPHRWHKNRRRNRPGKQRPPHPRPRNPLQKRSRTTVATPGCSSKPQTAKPAGLISTTRTANPSPI